MKILYREIPELGRLRCPYCRKLIRPFPFPQSVKTCKHYAGLGRTGYVRFVSVEATTGEGGIIPLLLK